MAKYQGQDVRVVRDVQTGDPEHDPNKDQVVIRMDDGSEKVVERKEVSGQ